MGIIEDYRTRQDIFYGYSAHKILERDVNHKIEGIIRSFHLDGTKKLSKNLTKLFASSKMQTLGMEIVINDSGIELSNDAIQINFTDSGKIYYASFCSKKGILQAPIKGLNPLNLKWLTEDEIIMLLHKITFLVCENWNHYMEYKREIIRYKKARQMSINTIIPFLREKLKQSPAYSFSIEHGVDSFKVIIMGLKSHAICLEANYSTFPEDLKDLDSRISNIFDTFEELERANAGNPVRISIRDKGPFVRNRQWEKLTDNGNIN